MRVGAGEITKKPVKLDMELIDAEKEKMTEWLKAVLSLMEK